jgi:CheY-like chemotaxis protein
MKRILLMDDEQIVLDLLSRMFTHLGYDTATCTDGIRAASLFAEAKAEGKPFDLVMLDLVNLQGMGGLESAVAIRKIDANAKLIATSGHLDHPVMLDHKKFGFDAAIEKPYKLEKLKEIADAALKK